MKGRHGVRSVIVEAALEQAIDVGLEGKCDRPAVVGTGERAGIMNLMSNLLLQHALYRLLTLPEEKQEEHAEAILERLEEDAVYIE